MTICLLSKVLAETCIQTASSNVYMNVNAMYRTPTSRMAPLILLAAKASAVAALAAGLLANRVAEPVIVLGVLVSTSVVAWHRVQCSPARIRSQHRFTVVSRCGDGFVTIDDSGVRHVAGRLAVGNSSN